MASWGIIAINFFDGLRLIRIWFSKRIWIYIHFIFIIQGNLLSPTEFKGRDLFRCIKTFIQVTLRQRDWIFRILSPSKRFLGLITERRCNPTFHPLSVIRSKTLFENDQMLKVLLRFIRVTCTTASKKLSFT